MKQNGGKRWRKKVKAVALPKRHRYGRKQWGVNGRDDYGDGGRDETTGERGLELVVVGDVEGRGFLIFGDATLEEVLLLLDVHHLGEPRQRVLDAGGERGETAAFEAAVGDVVDIGQKF